MKLPIFPPTRRLLVHLIALACSSGSAGCANPRQQPSIGHRQLSVQSLSMQPLSELPWVERPAMLPPMTHFPNTETYSFKLKKVPAISIVEALAARENFSFEGDSCAQEPVNLFLKNVSAAQTIEHVASLLDLRVRQNGRHIRLSCDKPYFVTYKVDYPAVERSTVDTVIVNSQLGSPATPGSQGTSSVNSINGNGASLSVQTRHQNHFWDALSAAIEALLKDADDPVPATPITTETTISQQTDGTGIVTDSRGRIRRQDLLSGQASIPVNSDSTINRKVVTQVGRTSRRVIMHAESGLLIVNATQRQHRDVANFLETVTRRALKQVVIEATVAEVKLSAQYQKGIQWRALRGDATRLGLTLQSDGDGGRASSLNSQAGVGGFRFDPASGTAGAAGDGSPGAMTSSGVPALMVLRYLQPTISGALGLGAALSLLEGFGEVRVISNPKLAVLNQQTAVMKVVDNRVYFTVQVQTSAPTSTNGAFSTFNTQVHTVPVGFFMAVTPHIEDSQGVSLTVRPTVSRIIGFVNDPNPALSQAGVTSRIPEIQTREIESVMRLQSGEIALLGGLMQTTTERGSEGLPGINQSELGRALTQQEHTESQRTELVVLLRPVVQPITRVGGALQTEPDQVSP